MERTSEKGLGEGAIPFFKLKATPIMMHLPKVETFGSPMRVKERGQQHFLHLPNTAKMARGKGPIDPGMTGKRKITDFLIPAPAPASVPASADEPPAEEPRAKRRTMPQNVSLVALPFPIIELSNGRCSCRTQLPLILLPSPLPLPLPLLCRQNHRSPTKKRKILLVRQ